MRPPATKNSLRLLAVSCFFLSGSTGLMYEVAWSRLLGFVIGNTHFSITLVVSVFMAGLAIGSRIGGRVADRVRSPLRLYGILNLLVAASCLLVPAIIAAARPLLSWLYGFHDGEPEAPVLSLVRIAVSALAILVPTSFMGATLPALSKYFTVRIEKVGGSLGLLYSLNTLGAVAGAAFTGFIGIRALGLWGSMGLAIGIDVLIGVSVLIAARGPRGETATPASVQRKGRIRASADLTPEAADRVRREIRMALWAFFISGFANMLLQIAWTKALVLAIGNSTYAFSLIVTLFILGIAVGGSLSAVFADRVRNPLLALGGVLAATGTLVAFSIPYLGHLPILASRLFDRVATPSYGSFLAIQILLVSVVILPCTCLMGTAFPLVGKIRARALEEVGEAVGSAYFWNTLGSILGTLAGGFLFIPIFGRTFVTLYLGAGLSLAAGIFIVASAGKRGVLARAITVLAILAVVLVPGWILRPHGVLGATSHLWNPAVMSRGAYAYFRGAYRDPKGEVRPLGEFIDWILAENEVLSYVEGIHAPVAVVRSPKGEVAMRISGKVEASILPGGAFNSDLPHQVLAGHLPMLLHPSPDEVLTLGLGGGVTLGTLTLYPARAIDSLEISPEVNDAARDYFASANRGALTNPRVRNVVGDGRNHLEYTSRRYDVITSVPSNPWIAGIGNLFTVEFFEITRSRLKPGGIICNWIHKINMRSEDFRTVARTFLEVYGDHAQLWDLGLDVLLLGSTEPIRLDPERIRRLLAEPEIAADLTPLGILDADTLLRHFLFGAEAMRRYADPAGTPRGPLNRDATPVLEFSCPYGLYGHAFDAFESIALSQPTPLGDAASPILGSGLERAESLRSAFHAYQRVEARWEAHLRALAIETSAAATAGSGTPAMARPPALRRTLAMAEELKNTARFLAKAPDRWLDDRANAIAPRVLDSSPGKNLRASLAIYLLTLVRNSPNVERTAAWLEEAMPYVDENESILEEFGARWLAAKLSPDRAIPVIEGATARWPRSPRVLRLLGTFRAASGRTTEALATFDAALAAAADSAKLRSQILQDRGYALEQAQRPEDAAAEYSKALQADPTNAFARQRLDALERSR